jgi:hypothetical protein
MSRINSYTRWERTSYNCQRCVIPMINGSLLSAPVPDNVKNLLLIKMQEKIQWDCDLSSGGGVNATIPLPELPTIGTISPGEKVLQEMQLTSCSSFINKKISLCGGACGSSTRISNINPLHPGCRVSNSNVLPVGSKIIDSRNECDATRNLGAGPTITRQVKYKATYCLSNSLCKNGCVEESFFVTRRLPTKVIISADRTWTRNQTDHCCWRLPNNTFSYIECTACCECPPGAGVPTGSIPVIQGNKQLRTNFGWSGITGYRASNNPTEWRVLSGPPWVSIDQFGPTPAFRYNPPCDRIAGWPSWKCGQQSTERYTVEIQAKNSFGWSMPFCIAIEVRP